MTSKFSNTQLHTLALAIALTLGSASVAAQEMDHSTMDMPEPAPAADRNEAQEPAQQEPAVDPHAGHAMPPPTSESQSQPAPVDHAAMGHDALPKEPAREVDHAAMGHAMAFDMTARQVNDVKARIARRRGKIHDPDEIAIADPWPRIERGLGFGK